LQRPSRVVTQEVEAAVLPPAPAPLQTTPEREEMYTRMRVAVERIAAEYGNPRFAQFFSNDTLRTKVLKQRMQLLQNYDLLQAEISKLQKKKNEVEKNLKMTIQEQKLRIDAELAALENEKNRHSTRIKAEMAGTDREKTALIAETAVLRDELTKLRATAEELRQKIQQVQLTLNVAR
jgi:chromosome segregation ATPase